MAFSKAIDDTGSASDSNFYSNLSNLVFSLASVCLLPSKLGSRPSSTLYPACRLFTIISSIVSVASYPYSVRASIWMNFVSGFFQLFSTALVVDDQRAENAKARHL
ncbi:hypothetical protein K469DRAFT_705134 [Zopfia rhizophila CBS 207.26]|uniref:Uncharacterized protein n=1 Tax=Zopfia rhizophila CBS 207.26 TaxID=1314779 RepID=A0A6A6EC97_9PEZI|nr:hypothetical protein K469DRAFT_705134 [Zopfia rhizophila CBS 207.26]